MPEQALGGREGGFRSLWKINFDVEGTTIELWACANRQRYVKSHCIPD